MDLVAEIRAPVFALLRNGRVAEANGLVAAWAALAEIGWLDSEPAINGPATVPLRLGAVS